MNRFYTLFIVVIVVFLAACGGKDSTEAAEDNTRKAIITTSPATSITSSSAVVGGNVVSDNGTMVTQRGICYSSSTATPLLDKQPYIAAGAGTGAFTVTLTGLKKDTRYWYTSYCISKGGGISYGGHLMFIPEVTIGENYQGGTVFYVDSNHQHGLIASASDLTPAPWGCPGVDLLGAMGFNIYTGDENTDYIVTGCSTSGIAARLCSDLDLNGYQDWFLPSFKEAQELYAKRALLGGFSNGFYWTSTEYDADNAYQMSFSTAALGPASKNNNNAVRPIRAF